MRDVADRWYNFVPGILGGCAYISKDDEDASWDLRLMANWEDGYIAHKPPPHGAGSAELGKKWFSYGDSSVPLSGMPSAVAFSDHGDWLVRPEMNGSPGNLQYTHYAWGERIAGPLPDLTKGDSSTSSRGKLLMAASVVAA